MTETGERLQSHIPYPELYAPEAVDTELTKKILLHSDSEAASRPRTAGAMPTPIDLRRTPDSLRDDEILDSVSSHLGVGKSVLRAGPKDSEHGAEHEALLHKVNIALEEAHNYLKNTLDVETPRVWVKNTEDVISLIRNTSRYNSSNRKGLQGHAAYCALVSTGLAVFELQKKEAHTLRGEVDYLENLLTQPTAANAGEPLFYKYYAVPAEGAINVMLSGVTPQCPARVSMRDKSPESQITKFLMKPESTAEAALKDAIGVRIELKRDRVEDALVSVLNYLQKYLEASNLQIEDRNLLGAKRSEDFKKRKSEQVLRADKIPVVTDTSPLSADSFRVLKITGTIKVPGPAPNTQNDRPIEIQLVEPENKNESGLSSHAVYELKKRITVMTRLFGGCSEAWVKERTKRIAETEGYGREFVGNTIQGLQQVGFMIRMPRVRNRNVYAATDVYRRWLREDGLITDPAVRDSVMHKLGSA